MGNDWTTEVALTAITEEFESTVRHLDDDGTGLRVPFHGDFAGAKQHPGIGSRIRWWARELRCAVDHNESELTIARTALATAERERDEAADCGQSGVCKVSPGCSRHWAERNAELVRERDEAAATERAKIVAMILKKETALALVRTSHNSVRSSILADARNAITRLDHHKTEGGT